MKLNKYLLGLAVVVMGGLTACNTDVEGEYYPYSTDYAQFDAAGTSVTVDKDTDHATIPVSLTRSNTSEALTVNFTTAASHEGIFSNTANGTVTFAPGQGTATFEVNANNLENEVPYKYVLTLAGDPVGVLSMVQGGDTIEYKPGQRLSTVVSVQREGYWTPWAAFNSEGTGSYFYSHDIDGDFSQLVGEDPGLPFTISQSQNNPDLYKLRIEHWAFNQTMILDYDKKTGHVTCPQTFTGGTYGNYGNVYVADAATYMVMNDVEPVESDYGSFDEETGTITLPLYYFVDAGYFGVYEEYFLLDGFVRTDYSMELTYEGYLTDKDGNVFAQGNLTLSDDIEKAIAIVAPKDADAEAVADGIAAGDYEGVEVESGMIRVPIGEDLTGELQLIVAIIEEGEVKNVESVIFEYYGAGNANPWKKLGIGYYTDDFVVPMFTDQNRNPYPPETVEVEIEENSATPGLYRVKKAYAGIAASFGAEGGEEDLIIHAENPNAVYFLTSPLGFDVGFGPFSIISYGGDDIEYFTEKGYAADVIIENFPEDFGKLENGVITLPLIQAQNQDGSPKTYEDGSPYLFSGYTYMGQTGYYAGKNGAFKLVLPSAAASVKAKAKAQAAKCAKNHFKATLVKKNTAKTNMTRKQMRQMRFSQKTMPKTLKVFKR
ncbi:MAG: hypothetical protein J6Y23_01540 [Prevotella sp.]|nr:hypothetical protein [Prevotella sp.]